MSGRQCPATSKRTGKRCGQMLPSGWEACRWHGGAAKQVQRAAAWRLAEATARASLAEQDVQLIEDPLAAFQRVASRGPALTLLLGGNYGTTARAISGVSAPAAQPSPGFTDRKASQHVCTLAAPGSHQ